MSSFRRALKFAPLGALASLITLGIAGAAPPAPVAAAQVPAAAPVRSAFAPHAMVAAANPMAVEAGLKVLRGGGSAVDAAVAVQATLGLVEPQSSGLGGGSFMVFYDAKTHKVTAYNGRERAPAGATPDMFLNPDGTPMNHGAAMVSGRSAGVPGAIAMLHLAQSQHGRLKWSQLFAEPERLADQGFPVPGRMAAAAASRAPQAQTPDAVAYFTKPDGTRYKQGDIIRNPAYAATLRKLAAEGPKAILEGPIAAAIVAKLRQGPVPGSMTLEDLKSYRPESGPALCRPYRQYEVCTPPAPSGGPSVLEALGILSHTDIAAHGPTDPQGWYLFAQASRLMYADRDRYMGDPEFVKTPTEGLLDPAYTAERATLIGAVAGPPPPPGKPRGAPDFGPDHTLEPGGTTHFTVVDAAGNVVSMTTTVESIFGDGRMVAGFFLNNQLTDFSFSPKQSDGAPAANAVAPRKRPRSAMSPTIILDRQGRFVAAVGSPGGPAIVAYDLKAVVGMVDWKLSLQQAIELPNMIAAGNFYATEPDKYPPAVVAGLAAKGMKLTGGFGAEASGLHGIEKVPGGLRGAADPRREGISKGY
ncbi:gamma-glutamyltransferase [Phenylobacterium sp.]|uniref:gamma-glutamyltransferase n=1 Tax=Phenylobacterium sp. TaxID=1871053 RepID=UPI002DF1E6B3|nr:gamma-glutamyltransferase [Phenylobacterium sp.]